MPEKAKVSVIERLQRKGFTIIVIVQAQSCFCMCVSLLQLLQLHQIPPVQELVQWILQGLLLIVQELVQEECCVEFLLWLQSLLHFVFNLEKDLVVLGECDNSYHCSMFMNSLCRTHFGQYQLHWGDQEIGMLFHAQNAARWLASSISPHTTHTPIHIHTHTTHHT